MSKRKRLVALALCVLAALCVFLSSAYIARETAHRHVCAGESCPICQFIAQVHALRRGLGTALVALLTALIALIPRPAWRHWAMAADVPAHRTPVGRKIRLND